MRNNFIKKFEEKWIKKIEFDRNVCTFFPGDLIETSIYVHDSNKIQTYRGFCISKKNSGTNSTYTILGFSGKIIWECVFPLFQNTLKVKRLLDGRKNFKKAKLYFIKKNSSILRKLNKLFIVSK